MSNYIRERCLNDRGYLDLHDDLARYGGFGVVDPVGTVADSAALIKSTVEEKAAAAKAWASKKFGDKKVDAVYKFAAEFAYAEGAKFIEDVMNNTGVKKALDIGSKIGKVAYGVDHLVGLAKKGPPSDMAGLMAWRDGIDKVLNNVVAFAEGVGIPESVTKELSSWIGLGTGCSSAIAGGATMGPWGMAAGAAVCLAMVVVQLAKYLKDQPAVQVRPSHSAPVVFVPNKLSYGAIRTDTVYLASALANWYNVDSVATIYKNLNTTFSGRFADSPYPIFNPGSEEPPDTTMMGTKSVPAVDPWAILTVLDFDHGVKDVHDPLMNTRNGLFTLLRVMYPLENRAPCCTVNTGVIDTTHWLGNSYFNGHDVSAAAIRVGAALGRAAIAQGGYPISSCRVTGKGGEGTADCETSVDGQIFKSYMPDNLPVVLSADLSPFIRFDELINLFVAIGERERARGRLERRTDEFLQALPIRWFFAVRPDGGAYSATYWTRLWHGGTDWSQEQTQQLKWAVLNVDPEACRQFAYLRVIAAFSYLVTMYHWTYRSNTVMDLIAELQKETNPAARYLESPVDPRSFNRGEPGLAAAEIPVDITTPSDVSWDGCGSLLMPVVTQQPGLIRGLVGSPTGDAVGIEAGTNSRVLVSLIAEKEARYEAIMREARSAAIDAAYAKLDSPGPLAAIAGTPGTPQFVAPKQSQIQFMSAKALTTAQINPAFKTMYAAGLVQVIGKVNPTFEENCIANGGTASLNALGIQQCVPTPQGKAQLEKRCRDAGGTPVWTDSPTGPRMHCQPPPSAWWTAPAGGNGIILLALAAGLVYLATRK